MRRAGIVGAALLLLAACGERGGSVDDPFPARDPTLAATSPVALTPTAQEGDAALVRGQLTLEEGCLYLRMANGTRVLPAFPWPGTHWNAGRRILSVAGHPPMRVGDVIEAGGGFVTPQAGADNAAAVQRLLVVPRPRCDTRRVVILYFGPNPAPIR